MLSRRQSKLTTVTLTTVLTGVVVLTLSACSGKKIEKMPDMELVAKNNECLNMNDPAPAMIFACKNYKQECERRRTLGRYIC